VVERHCEVVWTKISQKQLNQAHTHIRKDSPQNATKVIAEIVDSVLKAASNPEIYSRDKYKTNNDGSFRAFEKHHYRISFRFSNNIIRVLRVRHTSLEPKEY